MRNIITSIAIFFVSVNLVLAADFSDNFNRASLGSNWTNSNNDGHTISSNQVVPASNWGGSSYNQATYTNARTYMTIVDKNDGHHFYMYARNNAVDSVFSNTNYYIDVVFSSGTDTVSLYYMISGSSTQLGSTANQEISLGDAVGLECNGTSIKAIYKPSGGNFTDLITQTDNHVTAAGYIGFVNENMATTIQDDFVITDLSGGGTPAASQGSVLGNGVYNSWTQL